MDIEFKLHACENLIWNKIQNYSATIKDFFKTFIIWAAQNQFFVLCGHTTFQVPKAVIRRRGME